MQKSFKHSNVIDGERAEGTASAVRKRKTLKASVYYRKGGQAYTFSLPEEKEKFYAFCTENGESRKDKDSGRM